MATFPKKILLDEYLSLYRRINPEDNKDLNIQYEASKSLGENLQ